LLREAAATEGGRTLRYAENIMASGRMLLGLINDLLDLAKIEAGKLELHLSSVDMADMARNLIDFMRPLAEKKSLQLVAEVPQDIPRIQSDAGRIQQILYNLLSNAVKFTPEGGLVELKLSRVDEEHISIVVRDTGLGIPADKLSTVFEKFRQLDESMTREHSGTGLGLAISKELVSMLGGRISATSEEAKGSVFTVILPVAAPPEQTRTILHDIDLT
jgi:signal transduction histidine kinase